MLTTLQGSLSLESKILDYTEAKIYMVIVLNKKSNYWQVCSQATHPKRVLLMYILYNKLNPLFAKLIFYSDDLR